MAEVTEEFELVVKYNAIRLWLDLAERVGFQPINKKAFLAAVEPQVRKALEEARERTERERGLPASPVDNGPAVVGSVGPSVPVNKVQVPACEWGGGVCR
jgi:hypothetical protein